MTTSAPTKICFIISLVLFVLALVGYFTKISPIVSGNAFYLAIAAWVVLAIGNISKGF